MGRSHDEPLRIGQRETRDLWRSGVRDAIISASQLRPRVSMSLPLALTLLLSAHARSATPAHSAFVVAVAEMGSGSPIAGAQVALPELGVTRRTNWLGEVRFDNLAPGIYTIRVRHTGYAHAEMQFVAARRIAGPVFMLQRLPARDTLRMRPREARPWLLEQRRAF